MTKSLVTQISYKTAAPSVNRAVMEDAAWRHCVGTKPPKKKGGKREALTYDERLTINVIASSTYAHEGRVATTALVKTLGQFLDRKRDAVMRILRDLEAAGFIVQIQWEERGTVLHWFLRDDNMRAKLDQLADLIEKIDEVIAVQRANPNDPQAGKEMLPEGVYWNLTARRNEHRAARSQS